jgi:hypothetical protein
LPDTVPPEGIQINLNNNKLTELQDNNLTVKMTENSKTTAAKFLGVHFDPKLKFKTHIQTIQSKKIKVIFFPATNEKRAELKGAILIFLHCNLIYRIKILGSANQSTLNEL